MPGGAACGTRGRASDRMIAFLRGELMENDGEAAVVDVAGVGYQVLVSAATAAALPAPGAEVRLFVHTHFVTDEPLRLYGFAAAAERALFQTLIGVQGVGPRVALAILAGIETSELVRAIATGDVARLTQVKGVGKKTAERLALELREKILMVPAGKAAMVAVAGPPPANGVLRGPLGEVHGALIQLGYKPSEVEPLIAEMDAGRPPAELIREALAAMRRR
jgi:Holliday junction DNA helicase RuvA